MDLSLAQINEINSILRNAEQSIFRIFNEPFVLKMVTLNKPKLLMHHILEEVSAETGIVISAIKGSSAKREIVTARYLSILLLFDFFPKTTLTNAGEYFSCDHSTIKYALKRFKERIEIYESESKVYLKVKNSLQENFVI